jgi:hypothetical protein
MPDEFVPEYVGGFLETPTPKEAFTLALILYEHNLAERLRVIEFFS